MQGPMVFRLTCAILAFSASTSWAQAPALQSLQMSNQAPLTAIFATPSSSSARLLDSGQSSWGLQIDSASVYSKNQNSRERLEQDGEFVSLLLSYQFSWQDNWQLSLYLPWRYQSGGFADSIVDGWHKAFNLPEGGRNQVPKHRLLIDYRLDQQSLVQQTQIEHGLMDLRSRISYQLVEQHNHQISLSSELKFDHARSSALLGSGALAFSVFTDLAWQTSSAWAYQARLGLQYRQQPKLLSQQYKAYLLFANLGLSYQLSQHWYTQWQLELSSAQYDSQLDELGPAAQLSFGLSYLSSKSQLDIALSEDVAVSSAPDVALQLAWRQGF